MEKSLKNYATFLFLIPLVIYWNQMLHAGMLCGDEVSAVNLAMMPLSQTMHWLLYDSYPIGWPICLKGLIAVFGNSDMALRSIGLFIQVLMICSFIYFHKVTKSAPSYSLIFLMLPVTINHTGSMRAWGAGVVGLILLYARLKLFLENASDKNYFILLACSIFAVHLTYYNSVLMFALFVSSMTMKKERAKPLIGIGIMTASTMLVYVPIFSSAKEHYKNLIVSFVVGDFIKKMWQVSTGNYQIILCALMLSLCLSLVILFSLAIKRDHQKVKLGIITMITCVICFFLFLVMLQYPTAIWYYIPLVAALAATIDSDFIKSNWINITIHTLVIIVMLPVAWNQSQEKQSNVDDLIRALTPASKGDLIVLSPWAEGEKIQYYLSSSAETITSPPGVTNQIVTRYDIPALYIESHKAPEIEETKLKIENTLKNHGKVYIVSNVEWRVMHRTAPNLAELKAVFPNLPNSFYWDFIMCEQVVNYIQKKMMDKQVKATIPFEFKREHVSPFEYSNVIVIEAAQ